MWGKWSPKNWSKEVIRSKYCLGLIPWTGVALDLPSDDTSDSGLWGNHASSVVNDVIMYTIQNNFCLVFGEHIMWIWYKWMDWLCIYYLPNEKSMSSDEKRKHSEFYTLKPRNSGEVYWLEDCEIVSSFISCGFFSWLYAWFFLFHVIHTHIHTHKPGLIKDLELIKQK